MSEIFCVQDRTGTAAQLTIGAPTTMPVEVGDTGAYSGYDWRGSLVTLDFTVGAVNDTFDFCITTMTPTGGPGNVALSNWPRSGAITWLTGDNATSSPNSTIVLKKYPANAYTDVFYFMDYHASRGNVFPASPVDPIRQAIVKATDFLNQRYRYKGIKLLQYLANGLDPFLIDPWLAPGLGLAGFAGTRLALGAASTSQFTQWPRQGVVDYSGDQVWGVPQVIKDATCEGAFRVLHGTNLQPDYDPELVGNGGIVSSITDDVGPLKTSRTFDTKLGIGFFPDIPQIRRMLSKAGLLMAGGGRTILR